MARATARELLFYSSVPRNLSDPLVAAVQVRHPELKITMFQAGVEIVLEKIALEVRGGPKPTVYNSVM